jgi:hypothetical protein
VGSFTCVKSALTDVVVSRFKSEPSSLLLLVSVRIISKIILTSRIVVSCFHCIHIASYQSDKSSIALVVFYPYMCLHTPIEDVSSYLSSHISSVNHTSSFN